MTIDWISKIQSTFEAYASNPYHDHGNDAGSNVGSL